MTKRCITNITDSKFFRDHFEHAEPGSLLHLVWNMDFADGMVFALLATWLYRFVCRTRRWKLPWYLQYYTLMYGFFAVLFGLLYFRIGGLMTETHYLDDATMKNYQKADLESRGCNVTEARWAELLAEWKDEAAMNGEDIQWARSFTLFLPMWLLCTLLACASHTASQVIRIPKYDCFDSEASKNRHKVIIILALPFVYAFLSLLSVLKMWEVSANSMVLAQLYWGSVTEVRDALLVSYESNFGVADVFEAIALHNFAELMMTVINSTAYKREEARRTLDRDITYNFENRLRDAQGKLVFVGIRYFCLSCLLSALQQYVPAQVYDFGGIQMQLEFMRWYKPYQCYISGFVTGIGYVASFSAIENILVVEHLFAERREIVRSGFSIGQKFWSAKVLVSLIFFQQILLLLPPLNAMTETHKKLVHAGMLCFECFWISVFHFWAWSASDKWYDTACDSGSIEKPLVRAL